VGSGNRRSATLQSSQPLIRWCPFGDGWSHSASLPRAK
jgi:hypothetical protein